MKKFCSIILATLMLTTCAMGSFASSNQSQVHRCEVYYGVAPKEALAETCRWSVEVAPTVVAHWYAETDTDTAVATSKGYACGCDRNGENCDTCYTTQTATCRASTTCDEDVRTCVASGGESCSVSCYATSSYVDYTLTWSHDGWDTVTESYSNKCNVEPYNKTFERTETLSNT